MGHLHYNYVQRLVTTFFSVKSLESVDLKWQQARLKGKHDGSELLLWYHCWIHRARYIHISECSENQFHRC